jgi:uncharacterized membrane protein YfcA
MELWQGLLLIAAGIFAGFINTLAGGGSLLTLPIMIFMGLPPNVANASNRVAIFVQNIFGVLGFKSKGVTAWPYSLYLGISALFGSVIGSKIAVDISGELFNRILAIVMVGVVIVTVINPVRNVTGAEEKMSFKRQLIGTIVFFFIGIYGGFIHAGVGFLIMAAISGINHMGLVKTNSAKVLVVLLYTMASLVVFAIEGTIDWLWGGVLAIGNSIGAWIGARWQVSKGDRWVKRILIIMVIALSIKLWFF